GAIVRERPHHVDEILGLADRTAPHILIAVRKLRQGARIERDRLGQVELDCIAPRAERLLYQCEHERVQHELLDLRRAREKSAEPLRARAIKSSLAEGGRVERRPQIVAKPVHHTCRYGSRYDAISISREAGSPVA